jgi:arabinose-5-phosphate isomerase
MKNNTNILTHSIFESYLIDQIKALNKLPKMVDSNIVHACDLISNCEGKVLITGVGKSGLIGRKIAATFSSTGTPSMFVHAAEANHGDLGMYSKNDIAFIISNSGETKEIIAMISYLKKLEIPIITLTGNPDSSLSQCATVNINMECLNEAGYLNLAPTTSTTAALIMGDTIALTISRMKSFTKADFLERHPGGNLGKKLSVKFTVNKGECSGKN